MSEPEERQEAAGGSTLPLPAPLDAAAAGPREDQVRSSTAASKREFLQKKGLTEEEIGEAFRRVPDPPAAQPDAALAHVAPPAVQSTLQHLQPAAVPQPQAYGQAAPSGAMVAHQQAAGVRWTQVILGAGFLGTSAYAAKALLWPYLEDAYRSWRGHARPPPRPRGGNGAEAPEAPEATRLVAEAIQAQTAELRSSIESIQQLAGSLEAGKATGGGGGGAPDGSLTVADLRQELRSFAETMHGAASPAAPSPAGGSRVESELGEIKALLAEILRSPTQSRSRSPGKEAAAAAEAAATPVSVTSAAPQQQRAYVAAPVRDDPTSPAVAQEAAAALLAAVPLPAERVDSPRQQAGGEEAEQGPGAGAAAPLVVDGGAMQPPPHPASYLEVLEMLEKGQTPPGIRTDIDDKPPNPLANPAPSKLKPRPKPWEQHGGGLGGTGGSTGSLASLGGGGAGSPAAPPAAGGAAAAAAAASPTTPIRPGTGGAEGELAAGDGGAAPLSPVRVASPPADVPAAGEAAAAAAGQEADQRAAQPAAAEQQLGQERRALAAGATSFKSPNRPAASIFEAVAPAPDSPHVIAGRLSPGMGRSGSSGSPSRLAGREAPASSFGALLAAAEGRAVAGGAAAAEPTFEGSIGRPISRNWRPPPIPVSTLGGSVGGSSRASSVADGTPGPAAASPAAAAPLPSPGAAAGAGGGGLGAGGKAASTESLGEGFTAA